MSTDREFEPGQGFTREDWDAVSDNPPITEAEFAKAVPFRKASPDLHAALKRRPGQRGPGKRPAKALVTLRVDQDVLDAFKAGGEGWQTRMNEALRKAVA